MFASVNNGAQALSGALSADGEAAPAVGWQIGRARAAQTPEQEAATADKAEKDTLAAFDGKADKEEKEFVNAEEGEIEREAEAAVGAATDGELKMGHDGRLTGLAQAGGVL